MFSSKDLFFTTPAGGYRIAKSLRFRSSASAYLSRTPGSAGNRKTWTWSGWVKRGTLGASQAVFWNANGAATNGHGGLWFGSDDKLKFTNTQNNSTNDCDVATNAVFRDPSAWYHVVLALDTSNATAASRVLIYVNGVSQSLTVTTTVVQNTDLSINRATPTAHGCLNYTGPLWFYDGYLAEVNFIDGQALTPSSFGETDATTGVWKPKAYTGTYGTNGFYLKFADNSAATAAAIGKDSSGNGNNWTPNNISVTAGTTYDSMIDTPTPYDDGGNGVGNYATLNPLSTTAGTYSSANLRYVGAAAWRRSNATISISSGKWYFEVTVGNAPYTPRASNTAYNAFGFGLATVFNDTTAASSITNAVIYADNGYYKNFSNAWTDSTYSVANGDVLAVAVDLDANTFTFYQNNTSRVTGTIGTTAGTLLVPIIQSYDGSYGVMDANFGQRPFTYTPPSGFKALNTQNLPTPTIAAGNKHFDANLYSGNGATQTITNSGSFQPDLVWYKARNIAYNNSLFDAVRGATNQLVSNTTAAEAALSGVTAFTSTGFTLGSNVNGNDATGTYVAWQWKANGSGSSNTSGSITSTVSANATAGFSVVTYTGTGANATVGHGLGVAPSMIIVKCRSTAGKNWPIYHSGISTPQNNPIYLNLTLAAAAAGQWNNTAPTSSVFSVSGSPTSGYDDVNLASSTYVAYCFAAVAGYSAFGSYTGNGSADGPFIYTGFRPAFFMVKASSGGTAGSQGWAIADNKRYGYNLNDPYLVPNSSAAEGTGNNLDFVSNGVKLRGGPNENGTTYIYAAFAENPFKYALAR